MKTEKPFSSVRFLNRHEIGPGELEVLRKWEARLNVIKNSPSINRELNGLKQHFMTERRKVNSFIKSFLTQDAKAYLNNL